MMIRVMCLFSKRCRDMRKKSMFELGFDIRWRAQAKAFREGGEGERGRGVYGIMFP